MKKICLLLFALFLFLAKSYSIVYAAHPSGYLERADKHLVSGWAKDSDYNGPIYLHIYIDGQFATGMQANINRGDVGQHGFEWIPTNLSPGSHKIDVYALGSNAAGNLDGVNISVTGSPTTITNLEQLTISLPDNLTNFPVHTTEIGCDDLIGCASKNDLYKQGCYTGDNQSREWEIQQWKNEQSLCLDTNNSPIDTECSQADWAKETMTERACYWKSQKKVHFTVNTQNFSDKGCGANTGGLGGEPGGYGMMLMSGISRRKDWPSPDYSLGNLEKLIVSTDLSIDYFDYNHSYYDRTPKPTTCVNGNVDPWAGVEPIGFINMNVLTSKFDPQTKNWQGTQFYSVGLYDNRDTMNNPNVEFVDCKLPTTTGAGSFVNTGQPASFFGSTMASVDGKTRHYEIDILPRVKYYIQYCLGNVDFNQFRIDGAFFHNEAYNTVILSYDLINPQIKLIYKAGYNPISLPGDLNRDGKVNVKDYNQLVTDLGQTGSPGFIAADINNDGKVDIFDYNILVGNFGK